MKKYVVNMVAGIVLCVSLFVLLMQGFALPSIGAASNFPSADCSGCVCADTVLCQYQADLAADYPDCADRCLCSVGRVAVPDFRFLGQCDLLGLLCGLLHPNPRLCCDLLCMQCDEAATHFQNMKFMEKP